MGILSPESTSSEPPQQGTQMHTWTLKSTTRWFFCSESTPPPKEGPRGPSERPRQRISGCRWYRGLQQEQVEGLGSELSEGRLENPGRKEIQTSSFIKVSKGEREIGKAPKKKAGNVGTSGIGLHLSTLNL